MNICDDGHEQVCYEGKDCPFCSYIDYVKAEMDDLKKQISGNDERIAELEKNL